MADGVARAILRKDLSILAARPSVWIIRQGFVAVVALALGAIWVAENGFATHVTPHALARFSETAARALVVIAYAAVVLVAPLLAAGALRDERESGMLEVLAAAPVSARDLLVAIVGGRLVLASQLLVAALPLAVVPFWAAGSGGVATLLQGAGPIVLGGVLATTFAAWTATGGESLVPTLGRCLLFVVATPLAMGVELLLVSLVSAAAALCFLQYFVDDVSTGLALTPLGIVFPFWGFAWTTVAGISDAPALFVSNALTSILGTAWMARRAPARLRGWIASETQRRSAHESARPTTADGGGRRGRLTAFLARRRPRTPRDEPRRAVRSIARERLARPSIVERAVLRLSGSSPLVVREILGPRRSALPVVLPLLVFIVFVTALVPRPVPRSGELDLRAIGADPKALVAVAAALLSSTAAALAAARALPSRRDASARATLAATPWSGTDVVIGALGTAALATWPVVAIAALVHGLPIGIHGVGLWALASILLVVSFGALGCTAGLWAARLLGRPGERVAAVVAALFVLAVLPPFLVPVSTLAWRLHPVIAWLDLRPGSHGVLFGLAAAVACLAVEGLVAFALLARRPLAP